MQAPGTQSIPIDHQQNRTKKANISTRVVYLSKKRLLRHLENPHRIKRYGIFPYAIESDGSPGNCLKWKFPSFPFSERCARHVGRVIQSESLQGRALAASFPIVQYGVSTGNQRLDTRER